MARYLQVNMERRPCVYRLGRDVIEILSVKGYINWNFKQKKLLFCLWQYHFHFHEILMIFFLLKLSNSNDLLNDKTAGGNFRGGVGDDTSVSESLPSNTSAAVNTRTTRNYVCDERACIQRAGWSGARLTYYHIVFIHYNGDGGDIIAETAERIADHMRLSRNESGACIRGPWRRRDNRRRWVLRLYPRWKKFRPSRRTHASN